MKKIETIEQLKELKKGEKFFLIQKGDIQFYTYVCENPMFSDSAIALRNSSSNPETIYKSFFERGIILSGVHDSEIVGQYMIAQLEKEIQNIKEVYIK